MDPALLLRAPAQARSARPARAAPSPTKAAAAGASDEDSDGTSALPASTWKRPYSRRPQKDPNAPPHSRSAYALFMDVAKREEAAGASGAGTAETTAAETKTTLAARWKALSAEERARYDQLAAVERAQYNAALAAYTNTEPHRVRPMSPCYGPLFRAARCFGPRAVSGRALFRAARCFGPRAVSGQGGHGRNPAHGMFTDCPTPRSRPISRPPDPTLPRNICRRTSGIWKSFIAQGGRSARSVRAPKSPSTYRAHGLTVGTTAPVGGWGLAAVPARPPSAAAASASRRAPRTHVIQWTDLSAFNGAGSLPRRTRARKSTNAQGS